MAVQPVVLPVIQVKDNCPACRLSGAGNYPAPFFCFKADWFISDTNKAINTLNSLGNYCYY